MKNYVFASATYRGYETSKKIKDNFFPRFLDFASYWLVRELITYLNQKL